MADRSDGAAERVFAFEMALTHDEMVRLAAHLDPSRPIRLEGRTVSGVFGADGVHWTMSLGAARERAIGLIRFPIADVVLVIASDDDPTIARFLARFHLVFRKGGG